MFNIIGDGEGKYRVMLGDELIVGWVNNHAVGFRGMETETTARDAAIVAWRAMDAVLTNQYAGWPRREPRFEQMRITHDGAYEWFSDGAIPIARLLRPHRRAFNGSFGLELVLPSYATEGVGVAVAQAVSRALVPFLGGRLPERRENIDSMNPVEAAAS